MRRKEGTMKEEENTEKHKGSLIKIEAAIDTYEIKTAFILWLEEETRKNINYGKENNE
tara:strand:- start:20 stop:193 length:174 start_codon:yes stop_codon:yes gene_type:complete